MKTINCNNSTHKSVSFFDNAGLSIIACAMQDGEFWFTIGRYKTLANAKRAAKKEMAAHGYTFNEKELAALSLN